MSTTSDQQMPAADGLTLTRESLKALGELPDTKAGPLSPLARVAAPDGSADKAGLVRALEGIRGEWRQVVPALIDPGLTIMMVFADGENSLVGQYLWSDPAGAGPGFRLDTGGDSLILTGPLDLDTIRAGLTEALSLGGAAASKPGRLALGSDQFHALVALADAYGEAAARRRLARLPGPPPGFVVDEIVAAWQAGTTSIEPGWSVSLFSLLTPDAVPEQFDQRLPGVIREMADTGLLAVLENKNDGPQSDIYLIGEPLDRFFRSLTRGVTNFGLLVQRRVSAGQVEATVLGGWRTADGIWMADVSALPGGEVELLLLDPPAAAGLLDQVLGSSEEPPAAVAEPPAGLSLEAILERLKGAAYPAPATAESQNVAPAPALCPNCGEEGTRGASFCHQCGQPLGAADMESAPGEGQPVCASCGRDISPGATFCRHCGVKVGSG